MNKNIEIFYKFKEYTFLVISAVLAYSVFGLVYLLKDEFSAAMSVANYLTWHNLFEFSSVLISLSVFVVSYYTYEQTRNLRSVFLGSIFLAVGLMDAFHTLSYKGMPAFLVENSDANRATTLWIISRLIAGAGFLAASFIRSKKGSGINRRIFLIVPMVVSFLVLIIVTFFPWLLPPMFIEGSGLTAYKILSEYIIILLFVFTVIKFISEYKTTKDRLVVLFCVSLVMSIFSEIAFVLYSSVYDIYNYLGHIYKFLAFFIIFRVIFINNIQQPYHDLYQAKQELKEYADNLDKKVQERTIELKQLNEKLLEDLEYARDIQKAMFPSRHPVWDKVLFEVKYYPAERVSGDFYNVFKLDNENIGFYIGDVSGHGVPAAMLTVFLNQTVKTLIEVETNELDLMSPSEVLDSIYKSFNTTNFREDVYIVMLYGVYNTSNRTLTYSSAGLNVQPLLIRHSGEVSEIELKGFPICKFIEFYSGEYENNTLSLNPKDKILFYTDGLTEAHNSDNEFFGDKRLKKILNINKQQSAHEIAQSVSDDVFEFMKDKELKDDITFFIMEVLE